MNGVFYTLRWKGLDFRNDEHIAASENTVRIGQREDCDVRLANDGAFADELFAVINPTKSADGWQIISTSEFVRTFVNGSPIILNHYLKSGDRISFSETSAEILFEIKKGDNAGTAHFTSMSRRFIAIVASTAAVVVGLALYGLLNPGIQKSRNLRILKSAEQSVIQLSVDSIYFVRTVCNNSDTLGRMPSTGQSGLIVNGTAFLTTDGLLVTARHCIEPWLNYNLFLLARQDTLGLSRENKWALEAETYNQMHKNDTSYRVVSKCSLRGSNGYMGAYWSSDFAYNDKRDEIVEIGDFSNRYFIRNIIGRFNRSDMMLDDLAAMRLPSYRGTISIPSEDILKKVVVSESSLTFKGFPRRQVSGIETAHGEILKDYEPGQMISHNGGLEPGYSGGPALFVYEGKVYTAGVISTFDRDSKHCIYSVPITELKSIPGL